MTFKANTCNLHPWMLHRVSIVLLRGGGSIN